MRLSLEAQALKKLFSMTSRQFRMRMELFESQPVKIGPQSIVARLWSQESPHVSVNFKLDLKYTMF